MVVKVDKVLAAVAAVLVLAVKLELLTPIPLAVVVVEMEHLIQ